MTVKLCKGYDLAGWRDTAKGMRSLARMHPNMDIEAWSTLSGLKLRVDDGVKDNADGHLLVRIRAGSAAAKRLDENGLTDLLLDMSRSGRTRTL